MRLLLDPKRTGLICFVIITLNGPLASQSPSVLRSALGAGGASISLRSGSPGISFQQSIGQNGVTGIFNKMNLELRQGFLQPVISVKTPSEAENREYNVYPNPFSTEVFLKREGDVTGRIDLRVLDITGKPVYSNKIQDEELIRLDLSSLNRGIYFLIVKSSNIQIHYKIIKY